jgi:hypothetical protein
VLGHIFIRSRVLEGNCVEPLATYTLFRRLDLCKNPDPVLDDRLDTVMSTGFANLRHVWNELRSDFLALEFVSSDMNITPDGKLCHQKRVLTFIVPIAEHMCTHALHSLCNCCTHLVKAVVVSGTASALTTSRPCTAGLVAGNESKHLVGPEHSLQAGRSMREKMLVAKANPVNYIINIPVPLCHTHVFSACKLDHTSATGIQMLHTSCYIHHLPLSNICSHDIRIPTMT